MRQCEYKAKHEGRIFAKIGTFYPSSKTCSACGHKLKDLEPCNPQLDVSVLRCTS